MSDEVLTRSCPQCGAPVSVPHGAPYARCAHCASTSFIDLSGTLLHQVLRPAVPRARVPGLLAAAARASGGWELDVTGLQLVYEPVWELDIARGRAIHVGARPAPDGRYPVLELPGGERAFVQPGSIEESAGWQEPELAPESAAEVAARTLGRPVAVSTIRLLHRPVYHADARVAGAADTLRVDAVTGAPLDPAWPERPVRRRHDLLWIATAAMIAAAALIPLPWSAAAVLALGIAAAAAAGRS